MSITKSFMGCIYARNKHVAFIEANETFNGSCNKCDDNDEFFYLYVHFVKLIEKVFNPILILDIMKDNKTDLRGCDEC